MLPDQLQEQVHMLKMFFLGEGIDENFIKENEDKFFEIWFEQLIHEALKSGWGITSTKWNDHEFIMAFMSLEGSLGMSNSFMRIW